ncbi:XRE family transcriptional regulator [Streptomyces triticagri]|uniref:XRE family transcriptional regulator n=1 Tax=Streptomyces triticagri TaxID=2293568 RepID=A0A372M0I0_9ACTN|nr:helix-turn-helix transcriptional regulator [Streptomyces triticagri]RFU84408.1 XRE family transcriptional regulator [Streptomyces triticagri]
MVAANRELADFLRRARAQCDPSRAGLPPDTRVRRVPGLRREEVARLAGVSADYYARLEQGRHITPSSAVVEALAEALELDAAGRAHLDDLIGTTAVHRRRRPPTVQRLRPGLHQLLDSMEGTPALVLGRRADVLGINRLAKALFTDFDALPPARRNYTRWLLLAPEARTLFVDWERQARAAVESLRLDGGRTPDDRPTQDLITELKENSTEFGRWWQQHRVHQRTYGSKRLLHPLVGEITVQYETFALPGDTEAAVFVYSTEAGSPSRHALDLLTSWTLTPRSES